MVLTEYLFKNTTTILSNRFSMITLSDYLKIGSCDFKNSFYFGIMYFPSVPGMDQNLRMVKRPFRSRSTQCELD